jgi:hypothetical protein
LYALANPGFGYEYEIAHAGEYLREGLTESPEMGFSQSRLLIEILDAVRRLAGIHYPQDR